MLLQLSNPNVIKLVLNRHATFVRSYDIDKEQADMLDMSIVEYHEYMNVYSHKSPKIN
jgi:hypothetical protein